MSKSRARAQIRGVRRQELFCRAAALIAQHGQEFPLSVELRGRAKARNHVTCNAVNAHLGPASSLTAAWIGHLAEHSDHPQLFQQCRIEGDFVDPIQNLLGRAWGVGPFHRIDLNQDRIDRRTFPNERRDRGIAREPAVPIGLAIDLDGLKHRW